MSYLAWECLGILQEKMEDVAWEKEALAALLTL